MNKLLIFATVLIIAFACSTSYTTVNYSFQNHPINKLTDSLNDNVFIEILSPYKNKLTGEMSEIICCSDTSLVAFKPESPLSNCISDLILDFAGIYAAKNRPEISVDFSLVNHGGLRTSLPNGNITVGNIFELMPFENELVLLKLTGRQVNDLANYIASRGGEGVSGIRFGMRSGRAEAILIQGKALNPDLTYWLVTNDYLANGGDGMNILTQAVQRLVTNAKIRDVIIDQLRELKSKGQTITAKIDGRIYNVE